MQAAACRVPKGYRYRTITHASLFVNLFSSTMQEGAQTLIVTASALNRRRLSPSLQERLVFMTYQK